MRLVSSMNINDHFTSHHLSLAEPTSTMATTSFPPLLESETDTAEGEEVIYRELLTSHLITRLATQGWLFITPLVLIRFTGGHLIGAAVWGLTTMLATAMLNPGLGAWADQTDRCLVVTLGVAAQAVAVLGATAVLAFALQDSAENNWLALFAFIGFSVVEKLGVTLSDVAVKREWAPRLFAGERLKRTNSMMSQIDLISETVGPFVAGLLITPSLGLLPSEVVGFLAVGFLNVLSFPPQLLLLRRIYAARKHQLQPLNAAEVQRKANPLTPKGGAWSAWFHHPSGIQFLGISYSVLYLTVLSPHGAFLTAHLAQRQVPLYQLSLLRGAGALCGISGLLAHPPAVQLVGHRSADGVFVVWLAAFSVFALLAFDQAPDSGLTLPLLIFMVSVCLAREGLYGFELGVLNTEQELSDARHRSAIGAVDSALTSLATLVMYASGLVWGRPDDFGFLVCCSTVFVSSGAVIYLTWMLLYHSHRHRHDEVHCHEDGQDGHGHSHPDEKHTPHIPCNKRRHSPMAGTSTSISTGPTCVLCNEIARQIERSFDLHSCFSLSSFFVGPDRISVASKIRNMGKMSFVTHQRL